ncbi:MAG: hypothetical protein MJ204_09545 [Bacteroidales bacterium]|nr:hypothetical protein [Bacteroidales bacterium]
MKKIISLFVVVLMSISVYSQFTMSSYQSVSSSKIGVGYSFDDKVFAEIRLYGGLSFKNFTAEPVVLFNFCKKETHNAYVGAGMVINYITGPVLPMGIYIKPFENMRNLRFCMEAEPIYNIDGENFLFNCSVGLVYSLKD